MTKNNLATILLVAGTSLVLGACSTNSEYREGSMTDPFESSNRTIFAFNKAVDKAVIHPVVKGYRFIVPEPGRKGLRNFLRNLKSPVTLANEVLQGDVDGAGKVVLRAVVNTLVGVGGVFDVAGSEGYEYEQEDFGQTLGAWGVGHGPYLVLPILGPSSARDYAGYIVDSFADPLRWYLFNIDEEGWYYAKVGVEYLDLRESLVDVLEELEKSSIDYYAAVRSTYYQRREALVRDQMATPDGGEADHP
ncbi:MAG: VacJ family lipoprotein [Alphaproteobacteria bacterium]|jgi:phospholipid-binding lipoprotein MlaA|nr:VacJ family lipoprotein [Alphaproteobacteria bacterium]